MKVTSGPKNSNLEQASHLLSGRRAWWRIADLSIFAVWLLLVAFTVLHHEKWADEAQSWLLARDLDLPTLWFKELRYEGTPGLWHTILWLAQRLFHVPYAGLGVIGMLCAAAGVALTLTRAPFPRPMRWLLVFSYYMVYQYAVVARPYVLLPLLAFVAAFYFKDVEHPERITIALALLANLSVHGVLFAVCIGVAYLLQAVHPWQGFTERVRGRYVLSVGAMLLLFLFLFAVLKPPSDVEALTEVQHKALSGIALTAWHGINGAFFDFTPLTIAWLALVASWCFLRKGANGFLSLLLIFVMGGFYGVYGWVHHQGTIFIAAITGLWISWPTSQEQSDFSLSGRRLHQAMIVALFCLMGYQTWNAAIIMRNDYRFPYCGAEDAAKYLKSVGADRRPLFGYLYGMVAVEAYFDHNIQANRSTAYFHHGLPFDGVRVNEVELQSSAPDYVILPCWFDPESTLQQVFEPMMQASGYSLVHISDGYVLSKRSWDVRQVYFIYRRNTLPIAP